MVLLPFNKGAKLCSDRFDNLPSTTAKTWQNWDLNSGWLIIYILSHCLLWAIIHTVLLFSHCFLIFTHRSLYVPNNSYLISHYFIPLLVPMVIVHIIHQTIAYLMAKTMSVFFIFVSKAPDTEQSELRKYLLKLKSKYSSWWNYQSSHTNLLIPSPIVPCSFCLCSLAPITQHSWKKT